MKKQIGLVELVSAIQYTVQNNTKLNCYDVVPKNTPTPFYVVELIGKQAVPSKTMYVDKFTFNIHVFAKNDGSSVQIYQVINLLEEALTDDILLPDGYYLVMQTATGIQSIYDEEETNEKHAILTYEFTVCYDYKIK